MNDRSRAWSYLFMACGYTLVLSLVSGCQPAKPWETAGAKPLPLLTNSSGDEIDVPAPSAADAASPPWGYSGSVTAMAAQWPSIPNGYLQLPRLSPAGDVIAFQQSNGSLTNGVAFDGVVPTLDDLITGRRMGGVRLNVRRLTEAGDGQTAAFTGGCWPSWSQDGSKLVFVIHEDGGSSLGVWDQATGRSQRKAVGLKRMLAPAIAPFSPGSLPPLAGEGIRMAVSAWGELPEQMVLFLVDWSSGRAEPGPPGTGPQFGARWLDANTLLYFELPVGGYGRPALMRWTVGEPEARLVVRLRGEVGLFDAVLGLMSVAEPLSPGLEAVAYLDQDLGQVVCQPLLGAAVESTLDGAHSAAWLQEQWLIAAGGDRVSIIRPGFYAEQPPDALVDDLMPSARRLNLMHGTWAVVGALPGQDSVVLVGPDPENEARFVLMQLWVVADSS